jgi:4-hydroxy-tetrahydrodipicolinate synthase
VALITPMTPTGDVNVNELRSLLQMHVEQGTDNLCILGTTAEASVMSMQEREMILKIAVEEVKGKMPILVGTGTINPTAVKAMTQQAIDLGCDANLLVSPYYVKPPQRCIMKHMTTMADLGLPLIIYNIPGRTGVNLLDANTAILAEHENIVGIKDATGDLSRLVNLRSLVGDDFLMYSGDDETSLDFVAKGGDGCISVTANLAPKAMHEIMLLAKAGNVEEAKRLNTPLELLHEKLFCETNPIPTKWAAARMGIITSAFCRPPLDVMDPVFEADVAAALSAAGLI